MRFHDVRHTCATLLLAKGVNPKFVQELPGHADVGLTLNTYSHYPPIHKRDALTLSRYASLCRFISSTGLL